MPEETPKIIIDEGWKEQVQREREEAARKRQQELEAAAQQSTAVPEHPQVPEAPAAEPELLDEDEAPAEASIMNLVASLATQTMFALGVMAPPGARQVMVNLDQAKFMIDTLEVLRLKTKGNLDAEETAGLDEAIDELQRIYVTRLQQWQEESLRQSGINPQDLRGGL